LEDLGVDETIILEWRQWWAVVNTVTNLRISYKSGNLLIRWVTISFSRTSLFHGSDSQFSQSESKNFRLFSVKCHFPLFQCYQLFTPSRAETFRYRQVSL